MSSTDIKKKSGAESTGTVKKEENGIKTEAAKGPIVIKSSGTAKKDGADTKSQNAKKAEGEGGRKLEVSPRRRYLEESRKAARREESLGKAAREEGKEAGKEASQKAEREAEREVVRETTKEASQKVEKEAGKEAGKEAATKAGKEAAASVRKEDRGAKVVAEDPDEEDLDELYPDEQELYRPDPEDTGYDDRVPLRRKRKKAFLLKAYFIYIIVLIAISCIVLVILWVRLSSYQKGLDEQRRAEAYAAANKPEPTKEAVDEGRAAQAVFENYAEGLDADSFTKLWLEERTDDPEDEATVKAYFDGLLSSEEKKLYLDLAYDEASPVYKIKFGETDAARVSLKKDPVGKWEIGTTELMLNGAYKAEAELPAGMSFIVNGVEISPSEEQADHFPYSSIENILTDPVVWHKYSVEGMLSEPEVSYGNEEGYLWSDEDNCYICLEEGLPDELKTRAEGFFRAYMKYTMSGGAGWKDYKAAAEAAQASGGAVPANPVRTRFNECCAYITADSVAYSMLSKAFDSTCYGLAYTDHDLGVMEERGPVRWAANCVSIDFFYHAYATLNGQRKDYSGGDQLFRVYFVNMDGSWKIWAFSA